MAATPAGDTATTELRPGAAAAEADPTVATPMLIDGHLAPSPAEQATAGSLEARILDATLACVARWGVAKTTLDDIAREAGCSRATVYRVLPGGKDALMLAVAERELLRFFAHLGDRLAAEPTLAGRLAVGIAESMRVIAGHRALQHLIEHEPGIVFPFISFDALDPLLDAAASFGAVALGPFLGTPEARATGEWAARIVLSYGFEPDAVIDLTDTATADRFVHRYLPHLTPAGSPALIPVAGHRADQERHHVHH